MKQIIYNGNFYDASTPLIRSESRGLRFGDGCFETMRTINGKIVLKDLHMGRLLSSLDILRFDVPGNFSHVIEAGVKELLYINQHNETARVRLTISRGEGGLYDVSDNRINYFIESWNMETPSFNKEGLVIDVYPDARKQCDHFSHIKNNNFLCYAMAARWVKDHELDDAILLNCYNRIADTTIANVFIVKDGIIKTPVLSEGCIAGVMRKFIINSCRKEGIPVEETTINADDLQQASEIFLTNAIRGIQWVKEMAGNHYNCQVSKLLYNKMVKQISA